MFMELQKKGVPEQALGGEECSMTTGENAKFTATVLKLAAFCGDIDGTGRKCKIYSHCFETSGHPENSAGDRSPPCCDRSLPSKAQVLMSLPLPAPYPPN
jgi:hypothetical protein